MTDGVGGKKIDLILDFRSQPKMLYNKLVRAKMRPKEGAKIELRREICQILSDLSDLQV